jgi:hypothetical protein
LDTRMVLIWSLFCPLWVWLKRFNIALHSKMCLGG